MTGVAKLRPRSRSLVGFRLPIAIAAFAGPLAVLQTQSAIPNWVRLKAAALWMCCLWPAWRYTRLPLRRRPPIPFLPLIGVTYGMYYALQGVVGSENVLGSFQRVGSVLLSPSADYDAPVTLALVGWLCLLGAAHVTRACRRSRPTLS